jgi:hypothetical protein
MSNSENSYNSENQNHKFLIQNNPILTSYVQNFLVKFEYPFLKFGSVKKIYDLFYQKYHKNLKENNLKLSFSTFKVILFELNISSVQYKNEEFLHFINRIFYGDLYKKITINEAAQYINMDKKTFLKKIHSNIQIGNKELKKFFKVHEK